MGSPSCSMMEFPKLWHDGIPQVVAWWNFQSCGLIEFFSVWNRLSNMVCTCVAGCDIKLGELTGLYISHSVWILKLLSWEDKINYQDGLVQPWLHS